MEDKLYHRRVIKNNRKGTICNHVEVVVSWDGGGVTGEKLKDLEFLDENISDQLPERRKEERDEKESNYIS